MEAPVSTVPASYMQAQHIRGFHEFAERGLDYSRLVTVSWDEPGQCDLRAMSYVINAHLRRHDTYRSWFEYKDDGRIVRRTMQNPNDVKFVPTKHGQMSAEDFQALILSTPKIDEWDCFSFGIIQYDDHFTVYVIVDHVHTDPMLMGMLVRRDPSDLRHVAGRRCAACSFRSRAVTTTTAYGSTSARPR